MSQGAARALAGRLGAWGIRDAGGDTECPEELYTGSQGALRASRELAGRLGAWGTRDAEYLELHMGSQGAALVLVGRLGAWEDGTSAEMLACARTRENGVLERLGIRRQKGLREYYVIPGV